MVSVKLQVSVADTVILLAVEMSDIARPAKRAVQVELGAAVESEKG